MIEGAAKEMPEEDFIAALEFAHDQVAQLIRAQKELAAAAASPSARHALCRPRRTPRNRLPRRRRPHRSGSLYSQQGRPQKAVDALRKKLAPRSSKRSPRRQRSRSARPSIISKEGLPRQILDKKMRCDGRGYDQLRPLSAETACFPEPRQRPLPARRNSGPLPRHPRPRRRSPGTRWLHRRRNQQTIHPALQLPAIQRRRNRTHRRPRPPRDRPRRARRAQHRAGRSRRAEFPYAIRVSSEIMESNGSTSMASVCAASSP